MKPAMTPADQLKVIGLAFLSILVMIGIITVVSLQTTKAVAGHHAAAGGEGHGDAAGGDPKTTIGSMAQDQTHEQAAHDTSQAGHAEGGSKSLPGDQGLHQPANDKSGDSAGHSPAPADQGSPAAAGEHGGDAKPADHASDAKPADAGSTQTASASGGNVEAGGKVFMAKTCQTCHTVSKLPGAAGTIGPKLDGLGKTAATRKPGMSAEAYIKESIENPTAFVTPNFQPMMPPMRASMSDQEYKDLVAFLASL